MKRLLKPDRLNLDPNSPTVAKEWKHWFRTFDNFIKECGTEPAPDKFRTIINLISHNVFDYIEDCNDYDCCYKKICYFCGNQYHQRCNCPTREVICNNCGVKGHFAKVCLFKKRQHYILQQYVQWEYLPFSLLVSHAAVIVTRNGHELTALIDSCSSESFISEDAVKQLGLEIPPSSRNIVMAFTTMNTSITGCCTITLTLVDNVDNGICLSVLKDLCSDIILGHNIQKLHRSLTIDMGGAKLDLII